MVSFLLGTRGSELAVAQSGQVAQLLRDHGGVEIDLVTITTQGDTDRSSLKSLGGIGVFAAALRQALLAGEVDLAVHSFKDLPTAAVGGLTISATPARVDPRDALVAAGGVSLDELPDGARLGTGSPRRAAQALMRRPDLQIVDIRGNVPTRIARALGPNADLDAVILARAGLQRLDRDEVISEDLEFFWAPAQGCLAVETRVEPDAPLASALAGIHDLATMRAVSAERAVLAGLQAGCAAPVGVRTDPAAEVLEAIVCAEDGHDHLEARIDLAEDVDHCRAAGLALAEQLLAAGADRICDLGASKERGSGD